jgi:hypothetical protein
MSLAAAFVAEVSLVIRARSFAVRKAEVTGLLQAAAEAACEHSGGPAYRAAREAARAAEDEHLVAVIRTGAGDRQFARRRQCEDVLTRWRSRFQAEARAAQRRSARAYWAQERQQWLRPDLFAHLDDSHPLSRIARFTPMWWALFTRCLHAEFSRCELAGFHLLDELPRLRRQAARGRKQVLAAVVEEWRDTHADELGLPSQLHYHVLACRGRQRARAAARWFNARVPGYTTGAGVAESAREALDLRLRHLPMPSATASMDN